MPIEFIGMIGVRPEGADGAAVHVIGGEIDPAWVRDFSRAHEQAGFDKVLVGYTATVGGGLRRGELRRVSDGTPRLPDRPPPRFVAPTLAAREAGHPRAPSAAGESPSTSSPGGSDADGRRRRPPRQGFALPPHRRVHDALRRHVDRGPPVRSRRRVLPHRQALSEFKPLQTPHIPLYFGGPPRPRTAIGGQPRDVYMLWGEPLAAIRERIAEVRAAAAAWGREPRFSVSLRPIIAATEARAWERARAILAQVPRQAAAIGRAPGPEAMGAPRLVDFARRVRRHDKRLWTPIAAAAGGAGNTTALVGTPSRSPKPCSTTTRSAYHAPDPRLRPAPRRGE